MLMASDQEAGEVWGACLWEARDVLGHDIVDAVAVEAWSGFDTEAPDPRVAFVNELIACTRDRTDESSARAIQEILQNRGLMLR